MHALSLKTLNGRFQNQNIMETVSCIKTVSENNFIANQVLRKSNGCFLCNDL